MADIETKTDDKMSDTRERRVIPSIKVRRSARKSTFEKRTFWGGDLILYTTPILTISIDYRTDFQMMSDMVRDLKKRKQK